MPKIHIRRVKANIKAAQNTHYYKTDEYFINSYFPVLSHWPVAVYVTDVGPIDSMEAMLAL